MAGSGSLNNQQTLVTGPSLANQLSKQVSAANYTLALSDAGRVIETTSGSAQTITIPGNAAAAFPVGTIFWITQIGAGTVTIAVAGAAVLRNPRTTPAVRAQYATVQLRKRATDEWVLSGDQSTI